VKIDRKTIKIICFFANFLWIKILSFKKKSSDTLKYIRKLEILIKNVFKKRETFFSKNQRGRGVRAHSQKYQLNFGLDWASM